MECSHVFCESLVLPGESVDKQISAITAIYCAVLRVPYIRTYPGLHSAIKHTANNASMNCTQYDGTATGICLLDWFYVYLVPSRLCIDYLSVLLSSRAIKNRLIVSFKFNTGNAWILLNIIFLDSVIVIFINEIRFSARGYWSGENENSGHLASSCVVSRHAHERSELIADACSTYTCTRIILWTGWHSCLRTSNVRRVMTCNRPWINIDYLFAISGEIRRDYREIRAVYKVFLVVNTNVCMIPTWSFLSRDKRNIRTFFLFTFSFLFLQIRRAAWLLIRCNGCKQWQRHRYNVFV